MLYSESHIVAKPLNDIGISKNPAIPNLEMLPGIWFQTVVKPFYLWEMSSFIRSQTYHLDLVEVKFCVEDNTHGIYTNTEQMEMMTHGTHEERRLWGQLMFLNHTSISRTLWKFTIWRVRLCDMYEGLILIWMSIEKSSSMFSTRNVGNLTKT